MRPRTTLGLAVLVIGVAYLLVRLDLIEADAFRFLLPVILLLYGASLLIHRSRVKKEANRENQ